MTLVEYTDVPYSENYFSPYLVLKGGSMRVEAHLLQRRQKASTISPCGWLQVDNHDRHIISSNTLRGTGIVRNDVIQHFGSYLNRRLDIYSIPNILHSLIIGEAVPNTITPENNEFIICMQRNPATRETVGLEVSTPSKVVRT